MGSRALPCIIYGDAHPYGRPFSGMGSPEAVKRSTTTTSSPSTTLILPDKRAHLHRLRQAVGS
jgi:hypothetical protein